MPIASVKKDGQHASPPCNDIGIFFGLGLLDGIVSKTVVRRNGRNNQDGVQLAQNPSKSFKFRVASFGIAVLFRICDGM